MEIGEKIKYYRLQSNMTQKELAKMSGVSESAIRKYEKGERLPKIEQLQKISEAMNISSLMFIDDKDFFEIKTSDNRTKVEKVLIADLSGWIENYLTFKGENSDAQSKLVNILESLRSICNGENIPYEYNILSSINHFISFTMESNNIKIDNSRYKLLNEEGE